MGGKRLGHAEHQVSGVEAFTRLVDPGRPVLIVCASNLPVHAHAPAPRLPHSTLLALQAAHWEAVAAALPACGAAAERLPPGPGPGDVRFGCITDSVVACVRAGAVLFTPAMRTVISEAFELRPEVRPLEAGVVAAGQQP